MTKQWILDRLKEGSTKWGLVLIAVAGAVFFTTEQLGEYAARFAAASALIGAVKLVLTQEKPKA